VPNLGDWDYSIGGVWESTITIYFTINGLNATGIRCDQYIYGTKQLTLSQIYQESGNAQFAPKVMCNLIPTGGLTVKFNDASLGVGV
jgi:hypothetical protein